MSGLAVSGTAIVIGAASGMGKATAIAYARYGASALVVADINVAGVQETARQAKQVAINSDFVVHAAQVDVRSYQSVEQLFLDAVEKFGRIDYSVSTAGIYKSEGFIADNPLTLYYDIQLTNAKGILHHTKAAINVMLKQDPIVIQGKDRGRVLGRGSIVNVCSDAGLIAMPGTVEYNASKFAAVGITKTAGAFIEITKANEYGPSQIRINAVCPGPIQTPLLERAIAQNPTFGNEAITATPLKRFGDVDEIADTILFLTSSAGSYVHGISMIVDGGFANTAPSSG